MEKVLFRIEEHSDDESVKRTYITAYVDSGGVRLSHTVSIPSSNLDMPGCGIEKMKNWARSLLLNKIKLQDRKLKIFCSECRNFLYQDTSGYGICSRDNELHSCSEKCMY